LAIVSAFQWSSAPVSLWCASQRLEYARHALRRAAADLADRPTAPDILITV
jgi:hypothetical protein